MIRIFGTQRIDNYAISACRCGSLRSSCKVDTESDQALLYCHGCKVTRKARFPWADAPSQESRATELGILTAAGAFSRLEIGRSA